MDSIAGLSPELVWGLFPRLVGVIYVIAFGSLASQAVQLGGIRGQMPVQRWLDRIRQDFPAPRRYFEYPTVLWFFGSDTALRILPVIGVLCGLAAIYGGPVGYVGLLVGWIVWLSLEPLGLGYPWDTMLHEVGFLVLFLPIVQPLPSLATTSLPLPTVAFMARWLVLRLMLGFGKDKFIGVKKDDALYLRGFFVWMPLPNPIGWYGHHAPVWLLKVSHLFMFFAEIIAPVLGLFAGLPRLIAFGGLVGLMAGIQLTGNWGFFNVAYMLLCVCLLDLSSSIFDLGAAPWADSALQWPDVAVHGAMAVMFLISLFYLPLNSWFTRSWVNWPPNIAFWKDWHATAIKVHRALEPLRWLAPFRIVNGYGVFPPNSSPPLRIIPVFEGSHDGVEWRQYGYRFMPSFPDSKPPFIAPLQPRLDHACYYLGNGIHSASLVGSCAPYGSPHMAHARASWFDIVAQRLIAGDRLHLDALGHNPFPDAPPKLVRIGMLAMTPTRPRELRATGKWWHIRRVGTVVRARGVESWPEKLVLPVPETFHPDFVAAKRRAPALRAVVRRYETSGDLDAAVLEDSDLTAAEVATFWNELLPMLSQDRSQWDRVDERAGAIDARFGVEGLYRLERIFERYVWILHERIAADPLAGPQAAMLPMSNFRYHMVLHEVLLDGREALLAMLQEPASVVARAAATSDATQLWALALLRYEQLMAHVCSFRWSEIGLRAYEQQGPGLFEYYPFLVQQTPPDEAFCPQPVKHADGEYTIEGFYPPPETS